MTVFTLNINKSPFKFEAPGEMPLLWVLRDRLGLTGTKYGCGIGQCGACTVHIDGVAVRSCMVKVADVGSRSVVTIEGLAEGTRLHPVQEAWIEEDVAQCGYCQAGQIMSAAALLKAIPHPTDSDIDRAMAGNFCRCDTYVRIRAAIHRSANGGGEVKDSASEGAAQKQKESIR